ncbi:DUF2269 family protein [Streptomyces albidoflavus]|uniref:DUF2269 family protein n=1 Tax=Streptomyces TaxID=1883 RepID=UPI001163DA8D|nr:MULTISPECIES: DUF2269 family protein [unclassified Streptomyces]QDD59628.1 DUF2269 family protein [Streptomyces albidoflavus]MCG5117805.1 DUF2269 family protein [Streptomyces sp. T7(2022)]MCK2142216.1 DUF2269 family protein [Streptomyces sp. WAC00276]MCQ9706945.1 DUF2269 family protein [Streptomyces sp. BSP1]WTC02929.1 DUF2269 family protein [Streptomyces albidoflavus]
MAKLFLSLHVLAAIVAIGPITVAASMFPRLARTAPTPETPALLHKICRSYAYVGAAVPVLGIATGAALGVLSDAWLVVSIVLTGMAAGLLVAVILPGQGELLEDEEGAVEGEERRAAGARLAMTTGVFNLLWAAVVVLMIVRPGSTTGV